MAIGRGVGTPISFFRDKSRMPFMRIAYVETVRWLAGNERFTFDTMKQTRTESDDHNVP